METETVTSWTVHYEVLASIALVILAVVPVLIEGVLMHSRVRVRVGNIRYLNTAASIAISVYLVGYGRVKQIVRSNNRLLLHMAIIFFIAHMSVGIADRSDWWFGVGDFITILTLLSALE